MKFLLAFIVSVSLISCTSFKKERSSEAFVSDSEFLKQGREIEDYKKNRVDDDLVTTNNNPSKKPKNVRAQSVKVEKITNIKKHEEEQKELIETENKEREVKKKESFPFKVGEEVVLSASYFGVEAGKIAIGVDDFKKLDDKKQFHFYAFGKTSSIFSMFYRLQNKLESLWDPQIKKPQSLAFDVSETKQKFKARVYFNWTQKTGEYLEEGWSKKKGDYKVKKNWKLQENAQDVVSAAFYVRTLPLDVGKDYKVSVMEEDKLIDVFFKVDRKEVLKTKIGKLNSLVLKPRFFTEGKFKQVGDISVWLTDDEYRQVVRIESKIKVGTVVAKLHSLRRPQ